jgi:hypothetical protein
VQTSATCIGVKRLVNERGLPGLTVGSEQIAASVTVAFAIS